MLVKIEIPKTTVLQAASLTGMEEKAYEKLLDVVQEISDIDITDAVAKNDELCSLPILVACGILISLSDKLRR